LEIAVNTRLLIKDKMDGIGRFTYETLKLMTQQHPEDHFYFFFDREFDEEFIFADNITPIVLSPQARHPFLFYLWFEHSVAPLLNKLQVDVFLSPDGFLCQRSNVKQLAVFHDLNFLHYPNDVPWLVKKYYHYFFPKFAAKATHIATVSEFSKRDIQQQFHLNAENIDVVFNGVSAAFSELTAAEKKSVKDKYTNACDYFLFVGSIHPRKNIVNLLKAFELFKQADTSTIKLVMVGSKYYWTNEMQHTLEAMKHKTDVVFTGRVGDEELKKITASAFAVTYVPYFEGFGIPIIEAMQCAVPVITSNITSMPEVAADAALLVDPFSVDSISQGMQKMLNDSAYREAIVMKGKKRAADFSWQRTADLLYDAIVKTNQK
jgi:glycosyltransferase involved in cell wall biosynthesis